MKLIRRGMKLEKNKKNIHWSDFKYFSLCAASLFKFQILFQFFFCSLFSRFKAKWSTGEWIGHQSAFFFYFKLVFILNWLYWIWLTETCIIFYCISKLWMLFDIGNISQCHSRNWKCDEYDTDRVTFAIYFFVFFPSTFVDKEKSTIKDMSKCSANQDDHFLMILEKIIFRFDKFVSPSIDCKWLIVKSGKFRFYFS